MDTRAATPEEEPAAHSTSTDEVETLSWRAHPARDRPAQAILAVGIVLVIAGFIYVSAESAGFAVLGAVILIGALNRFFFPSRFTIDEEGIAAAYPLRRTRYRWHDVQRFLWDEYGGYLSTRKTPSRLDAYRGMHLLFDEPNRDQIIARIRACVGKGDST